MAASDDENGTHGEPRGSGAFFGRRKGHRLRSHQASLFDTLLPRLAVDLTQPAPADLTVLFPVAVEAVHLEIGFGGGERLIAQAEAIRRSGFSAANHSSTAWRRRWPRSTRSASPISGSTTAMQPSSSLGFRRHRSGVSSSCIPIHGRSGGTGSGASCRTAAWPGSRGCSRPVASSASRPTGRTTRPGRSNAGCARRRSHGPRAGRRLAPALAGLFRHPL